MGFYCNHGFLECKCIFGWILCTLCLQEDTQYFARRLLVALELIGGTCHFLFFIVTVVTLAVLAPRSTSEFVWTTSVSGASGWNAPGVTFCLGLLSPAFAVAGMYTIVWGFDTCLLVI